MPDLAPIKCQMDGCEARIHHLCQRKWEDKNLVVEPNSTDVNVLFMLIVRETGRMWMGLITHRIFTALSIIQSLQHNVHLPQQRHLKPIAATRSIAFWHLWCQQNFSQPATSMDVTMYFMIFVSSSGLVGMTVTWKISFTATFTFCLCSSDPTEDAAVHRPTPQKSIAASTKWTSSPNVPKAATGKRKSATNDEGAYHCANVPQRRTCCTCGTSNIFPKRTVSTWGTWARCRFVGHLRQFTCPKRQGIHRVNEHCTRTTPGLEPQ